MGDHRGPSALEPAPAGPLVRAGQAVPHGVGHEPAVIELGRGLQIETEPPDDPIQEEGCTFERPAAKENRPAGPKEQHDQDDQR